MGFSFRRGCRDWLFCGNTAPRSNARLLNILEGRGLANRQMGERERKVAVQGTNSRRRNDNANLHGLAFSLKHSWWPGAESNSGRQGICTRGFLIVQTKSTNKSTNKKKSVPVAIPEVHSSKSIAAWTMNQAFNTPSRRKALRLARIGPAFWPSYGVLRNRIFLSDGSAFIR